MAERAGLENQYGGNVIRGSNPLASASWEMKSLARQPFFGEISSRFEFSIKFELTFLTGSLAVCLSAPVPAFVQEFPPASRLRRTGRSGRPFFAPTVAKATAGKQGEGESFDGLNLQ